MRPKGYMNVDCHKAEVHSTDVQFDMNEDSSLTKDGKILNDVKLFGLKRIIVIPLQCTS